MFVVKLRPFRWFCLTFGIYHEQAGAVVVGFLVVRSPSRHMSIPGTSLAAGRRRIRLGGQEICCDDMGKIVDGYVSRRPFAYFLALCSCR